MNDHEAAKECSRKTKEAQGCTHWETKSPAFWGHCSHASCPNYMEACPLHQTPKVMTPMSDAMTTMQKWVVKLDDGKAVSKGSLRGAADVVRDVLKTGHPCEIWHFEDGAWGLYERFEPEGAAK